MRPSDCRVGSRRNSLWNVSSVAHRRNARYAEQGQLASIARACRARGLACLGPAAGPEALLGGGNTRAGRLGSPAQCQRAAAMTPDSPQLFFTSKADI